MGDVVRFDQASAAGRPVDVGARLGRKLKLIRPDVRPEVEEVLEGILDGLLMKQAAGIARAARGDA